MTTLELLTRPRGERNIGYAPRIPRNDVGGAIAIAYGEAKLSDWVNLFGIVLEEDRDILKSIGETIWLEGARVLRFEKARL